jgi:hypothetical protein
MLGLVLQVSSGSTTRTPSYPPDFTLRSAWAEERIRLLKMPEIEGAQTLAFIVDDFVQEWAQHTETLLVDSTCEYEFNDYILSTNSLIT